VIESSNKEAEEVVAVEGELSIGSLEREKLEES
jgi:hypothetical protein